MDRSTVLPTVAQLSDWSTLSHELNPWITPTAQRGSSPNHNNITGHQFSMAFIFPHSCWQKGQLGKAGFSSALVLHITQYIPRFRDDHEIQVLETVKNDRPGFNQPRPGG
ncbi:hypothetical protein NEUTE2DRAFT_133257 [Neurospora tetrasperma FGSC 2509]|nr:hypothetical protein NEUTE2DRAFT_133257 [Neurospora tetrasperma FGSC 2509]